MKEKTLSDTEYDGWFHKSHVREFIKDIPNGIKQSIERGQFNDRYFESWLKKRVGEKLI